MLPNADYLGMKTDENDSVSYNCEKCHYTTSQFGHWNRHLKTKKHIAIHMLTDADSLRMKGIETDGNKWRCACGKHYAHKQSYYRHKATCTYQPPTEAVPQNQIVTQDIDKDALIFELLKRLDEKDKMMSDLIQRAGNNNTTNSHNTNIILQLNSNYPNALPVQYLIEQIKGNPKCVTHDPKLYAQAFIEALSQQTDDERTIRAIKDTMYVKYEDTGFKEDKEAEVFDTIKKVTERDQIGKAAAQNPNMFLREKEGKEYPELVSGIMKPLTLVDKKQMKKGLITAIGNDAI
jgi:hypothetical protein